MTNLAFIDLVLVLVAIEAVALVAIVPRRWPHVSRGGLLATLAAGATVMLALRAAVRGATTAELAMWMALALAAHLFDLSLRLSLPARRDRHG